MNKRTIAIVGAAAGAVLILALYVLIVRAILTERRVQASLKEELAIIEEALAGQQDGAPVVPTRQAELATLQAELAAAEFAFPSEVDSTAVLDYVIAAAADNGVTMREVQAQDPLTTTLGSTAYRIFAYDIQVEGGLDPIAAFLATLESGDIETLTLDQIRIEAQSTPAIYRASLVARVYVRR